MVRGTEDDVDRLVLDEAGQVRRRAPALNIGPTCLQHQDYSKETIAIKKSAKHFYSADARITLIEGENKS